MNFIKKDVDKTNIFLAIMVFIVSFVVYALTVQQTLSFWDCGEFIACSYILGIPHPPGTPLFVLIGRLISIIPFVDDIAYRINFISVVTSALTAMMSYLLTVKIVGFFFKGNQDKSFGKIIGYIGGVAGAFFVAFGRTNWSNSVEAEVYGMALALSVFLVWLALRYFETKGSLNSVKIMLLTFYLALLGVGIHMTVFLVVPICSIFFILKKEANNRDWLYICAFFIIELLMIIIFSDTMGAGMFKLFSVALALGLIILLYKKINWAIMIGIASVSTVMISFSLYFKVTIAAIIFFAIIGALARSKKWDIQWRKGLLIVFAAMIGVSVHLYIPIRSELNPRIDENNPSRSFDTLLYFLDRKQYGQVSMTDRMFNRRGSMANQFGRHPHMGFWSYFEEQYSQTGWSFIVPFFLLGLFGLYTAIKKRLEVGLPFMTLFLLCSVGLILYMNFADGTRYDYMTQDAYLEVRNRDYFFTPAFVFFGIAMGLGVSAVMMYVRDYFSGNDKMKKLGVYASSILVLLPAVSFAHNYHACDRSGNTIPYSYAKNILDTCEENSILFTAGDNDTFPVWCIQEVYNYRKDVTVVNLSLLNTDWYVEQMKNRYDVPISLTDEQILWYPYEIREDQFIYRPKEPFIDRPRKRKTFMNPSAFGGRVVKVQDMLVDEIVIENKWKRPIYFSSPPYAESPLNLRDHIVAVGLLYKLTPQVATTTIDVERSYDLFMNTYQYDNFENSEVYRDENATGVFVGVGVSAVRLYDEMIKQGDTTRAETLAYMLIDKYPEYWQMYTILGGVYDNRGDTAKTTTMLTELHDTLDIFLKSNPENLFYKQDLGLVKVQLGIRSSNQAMVDEGLSLTWQAFNANPNSNYAFRKLISVLGQVNRRAEMVEAATKFSEYKINMQDPLVQSLLGLQGGYPQGGQRGQ